jgi:hypothetical protein
VASEWRKTSTSASSEGRAAYTTRADTIRADTIRADTIRADVMAVASFTPATGLAFVVDFLVEFLEGLLPIRDFFVTAMGDSPRI